MELLEINGELIKMEFIKGNKYLANYYELDNYYIIVKNGTKWEIWRNYTFKDKNERYNLYDGYGLEENHSSLKNAKHDTLIEIKRRFKQ